MRTSCRWSVFWSLALFLSFVGIHHYLTVDRRLGGRWRSSRSMLLIIRCGTVLVNFFGTVKGRWRDFGKNLRRILIMISHVSARILPGFDRGPALDPAADALSDFVISHSHLR